MTEMNPGARSKMGRLGGESIRVKIRTRSHRILSAVAGLRFLGESASQAKHVSLLVISQIPFPNKAVLSAQTAILNRDQALWVRSGPTYFISPGGKGPRGPDHFLNECCCQEPRKQPALGNGPFAAGELFEPQ